MCSCVYYITICKYNIRHTIIIYACNVLRARCSTYGGTSISSTTYIYNIYRRIIAHSLYGSIRITYWRTYRNDSSRTVMNFRYRMRWGSGTVVVVQPGKRSVKRQESHTCIYIHICTYIYTIYVHCVLPIVCPERRNNV